MAHAKVVWHLQCSHNPTPLPCIAAVQAEAAAGWGLAS